MLSAIPLWLHLVAATVWVGSQLMMFAVVIPALRGVSDPKARNQALRGITSRFGYAGYGALLILVLTGIDNIDRYSPVGMFEVRYGYILTVKISLLAMVLALTTVHTFVIGPRLLQLQERAATDPAATDQMQIRNAHLRSAAVSGVTLLLSLGIVFCAALLRTAFAYALV